MTLDFDVADALMYRWYNPFCNCGLGLVTEPSKSLDLALYRDVSWSTVFISFWSDVTLSLINTSEYIDVRQIELRIKKELFLFYCQHI